MFACALDTAAIGQVPVSPSTPAATPEIVTSESTQVSIPCCKIAALTPVELEIVTRASSKTSRQGDQIRIRVIERVSVNGKVVVPEGTEGFAEVIQSSHGGFGGKAGELVIGAPYLMMGNKRVGLKRFGYGRSSGRDQTSEAMIATAFIGLPGMLIGGGNISVASGTRAHAVVTTETFIPVQP